MFHRKYIISSLLTLTVSVLCIPSVHAGLELKYHVGDNGGFLSMFFLDSQHGWIGGLPLIRTTDGGENWEVIPFPENHDNSTNLIVDISFTTPEIGFCRHLSFSQINEETGESIDIEYDDAYDGSLYKTTDGGLTWNKISALPDSITAYTFYDENTGWACRRVTRSRSEVLKTIDGGTSWERVWEYEVGPFYRAQLLDILSCSTDSFWIIQGETDWEGYQYTTNLTLITNNGATSEIKTSWNQLGSRSFGRFADASTPNLLFIRGLYLGLFQCLTSGYIRYEVSTDETTINRDLPPLWDIESVDNETYYFLLNNHPEHNGKKCLFYSTDKGETLELYYVFQQLSNNTDEWFSFSEIDERTFWIATGNGDVYKYANETVNVSKNEIVPSPITLYPPTPNPFNPTTTIRFDLVERRNVELIVYDVSGRKVTTLIDGSPMDAGKHDVVFEGSGLASGLYFYRLNVNGTVKTGKMVLVK